ncbi:MAG: 30S ribosomal protein S2 [Candidatus Micrarchaeia archaeon]
MTTGEFLVPQEKYLEAGIHIGTKLKTSDMRPFIYKARQDRLFVLDLKKIDERIRYAARFAARFDPAGTLVVASRAYAASAAAVFASLTGCRVIAGRFVPGVFTNPARSDFTEPKLVIVCDPKGERQAVREAAVMGIPIIALCDTDNNTKFVDWIIPCNNKGRKSLALIFYLLARETLKARGVIASDAEFTTPLEKFEGEEAEGAPAAEAHVPQPELMAEAEGAKAAPAEGGEEEQKEKEGKRKKAKPEEAEGGGAG